MGNRSRLTIRAITDRDAGLHRGLINSIPRTTEAVALSFGTEPDVLDGVLVRIRHTGTYAMWRGVSMEQVDQRKAAAALGALT